MLSLVGDSLWIRNAACGLKSDNDETAPASTARRVGSNARKMERANLNQKQSICSDAGHDAETRDGLASFVPVHGRE